MVRSLPVAVFVLMVAASAAGQTPQPSRRPGGQSTQAPARPQPPPAPVQPPPSTAAPAPSAVPARVPEPQTGADPTAPTAAAAVFPVYPTAQFIGGFDAGRGQRYLVYGATAPFVELVAYYRNQLKERGTMVFAEPPTHMFEVGRFRAETMAFPPGVTIKDWTWGGSKGYPNPKPGGMPERYPTIIMIVPPPPGAER